MPWAAWARPVGAEKLHPTEARTPRRGLGNCTSRIPQRFEAQPPHKGHRRGRFGSEALPHGR
jgi:hypothetical protein